MDLCVGDAGVAIDDGVDADLAHQRGPATLLRGLSGVVARVAVALLSADVPPASAVEDVPSFFTSTCSMAPRRSCS